jgi:hypothetical protein
VDGLLRPGQSPREVRLQVPHPLLQSPRVLVQNGAVFDQRVQLQAQHVAAVQLLRFAQVAHFVGGGHGESGMHASSVCVRIFS